MDFHSSTVLLNHDFVLRLFPLQIIRNENYVQTSSQSFRFAASRGRLIAEAALAHVSTVQQSHS
jgi:hypothetical protein